MKPESKPVSVGKATVIVLMGFVSGFCGILALLTYFDAHQVTARIVSLVVGSILSTIAAFGINRIV